MSFQIIALEKGGNSIYAIADKRVGKAKIVDGEITHWEYAHDDSVKLIFIKKDLYLAGFGIVEIGDRFLEQLKEYSHLPTSKIIEVAEKIDRTDSNLVRKNTHDTAFIFGKWDNGDVFVWCGDEFGKSNIEFANPKNHVLRMSGGLNDTLDKCVNHFGDSFKRFQSFPEAMVDTLRYAASIDKVISPEFDFVIINKAESRPDEVFLSTSDSGKRVEISGDDNSMTFYDPAGNEVFRLDDDIDSSQTGTPLGGIKMTQPNGRVAYGTGNGFFANGGGMQFLPGSSGISSNGSIVGLLFDRNTDSNGISAAIVGRDGSTSGNSTSYAGYFIGKVKIDGALDIDSIGKINGAVPHTGIVAYRNGNGQTKGMNVHNGLIIETELAI